MEIGYAHAGCCRSHSSFSETDPMGKKYFLYDGGRALQYCTLKLQNRSMQIKRNSSDKNHGPCKAAWSMKFGSASGNDLVKAIVSDLRTRKILHTLLSENLNVRNVYYAF